ncbi:MAG: 4-diphosphocytidyl-2C-methyl-D-erythritol kinase [Aquificae bacterium]|nr:4-diphosphocytidyl-2C-methyl-D-erythritol kinase [Aquificota bacterium]
MERLFSSAKVNLGLWVVGRRPDGYHEIVTVYKEIPLYDEITLDEGLLEVRTDAGIPERENLVYKGLLLFKRLTGIEPRYRVFIKKRVPVGSGLGGGSANLATVLKRVNELEGSPLGKDELARLVGSLSSDAPFFLVGGCALGLGRGERVAPARGCPGGPLTVVVPPVSVSTARVYKALTERHFTPFEEAFFKARRVLKGRLEEAYNALGELSQRLYPEVGEVVRYLKSLGLRPLVSGTGSAVFFLGPAPEELKLACRARGWRLYELSS